MDIIVLRPGATSKELRHIINKLESRGFKANVSKGTERTVVGVIGDTSKITEDEGNSFAAMPGVEKIHRIIQPFKLASRDFRSKNTTIKVGKHIIGGKKIHVMAGPCAVESMPVLVNIAKEVSKAGASFIRGGAFKPRTSPYSFQGLGEEGLKILAEARSVTGMPVVTEVMNPMDVELVAQYTDILQVGARNVQNFSLLKRIGKSKLPILLKRGMMTTITEFLMSAEYCLSEGSRRVVLCERGIRTFEDATRNTLDISAVPVLKERTHLPVIVDPSHGTGHARYVPSMSCASVAAGADGLMIEVHPSPEKALSDGPQSLTFAKFGELMEGLRPFIAAAGRTI